MARRRSEAAADAAAAQASEAARVLQQRGQEAKAEKAPDPAPIKQTPKGEEEAPSLSNERLQELRKGNPRLKAMAELEARGDERRGYKEEEEPVKEPANAEETTKAEEPKVETPVVAEAAVAAPEAPVEPKKVKQIVDGEEYEVEQAELDEAGGERAWRKQKAADNRLAKSAEANKQTQAQLAQVMQILLAQQQKAQPPEPTSADLIKQKLDIIRFGTPEEASAAFAEVISKSQPKQIDQNALVGQALAAFTRQSAVADFAKKNPHIMSNPLLLKLARSLETEGIQQATQAGQAIDWQKLYDTIGVQVSSVAPRQSQPAAAQQTASTPSQPSEKEARKASIVNLPTAATRAEAPKEEKEPTRDEILFQMKKARGQTG